MKKVKTKDDTFKRNGFSTITGCGITAGKSLLFVEYALHLDSHMIPRRSSLLTRQMALKTGRRARKE